MQLNCVVSYNEISRPSIAWKGVEDAPAVRENGTAISLSYFVVASAPEVPSFTCIASFAADNNGATIIGLAKNNIPNATIATSAIKVHCKYFIHDVEI